MFFTITPSGRILNRFTNDMFFVDHKINHNIILAILKILLLIASFVLIIIFTPWSALVCIPIIGIYFFLQVKYDQLTNELCLRF